MKTTLQLLCFLIVLLSCSDKEKKINHSNEVIIPSPEEVLREYVQKPNSDDRICKEDLLKANKDLAKYKNIYVTTSCFGCKDKTYENESINYAKSKGFKVINYDYSCVIINGQTQGCYYSSPRKSNSKFNWKKPFKFTICHREENSIHNLSSRLS